MAKFDYGKMQDTAKRLMDRFAQGTVYHIRDGAPTGPVNNPTPGVPVKTLVDATVSGVDAQYIQEGFVTGSDLQMTVPEFGIEPLTSDRFEIDGREHEVIRVDRIPASGVVVAYRMFLKS